MFPKRTFCFCSDSMEWFLHVCVCAWVLGASVLSDSHICPQCCYLRLPEHFLANLLTSCSFCFSQVCFPSVIPPLQRFLWPRLDLLYLPRGAYTDFCSFSILYTQTEATIHALTVWELRFRWFLNRFSCMWTKVFAPYLCSCRMHLGITQFRRPRKTYSWGTFTEELEGWGQSCCYRLSVSCFHKPY